MKFDVFCTSLENKIKDSYENGVTMDQAEKLAGEFLYAQMVVSNELKRADLDSRMRKAGLKSLKAQAYMDACSKSDKKPTETALEHIVNTNELVKVEHKDFDEKESLRDNLTRYYNIFREAHIHFRGISKGKFD